MKTRTLTHTTLLVACSLLLLPAFGEEREGRAGPGSNPVPTVGDAIPIQLACKARPDGRIVVNQLPGSGTAVHVITAPGSYILEGEVEGVTGKNGIEIDSNEVTLDLNGYTVRGVPGSLTGVRTSGLRDHVFVRNGTITRWGEDGLKVESFASTCGVEGVTATHNTFSGLQLGANTRAVECRSDFNGFWGIQASADACHILRCTLAGNSRGIIVGIHGTVESSTVLGSHNEGLLCFFDNGRLIDNFVSNNRQGIDVAGTGCLVEGNRVVNSQDHGISLASTGNLVRGNSVGNTTSGPDYVIPVGNAHGPIHSIGGVGDISTVAGTEHPDTNLSL